ncbi:MAG TPA: TadE family protein [Candidatus Limnocylindrales bacterium]|jgi:Flp pilus assembly protein TadG
MRSRVFAQRRRLGRGRRGQSLVEFTLVLPLFLLLVAGMVDFGIGLYSNITVINAAREGARYSVTAPGDAAAVEARVRAMASGLNDSDMHVTTTCQRPDPAPATTWNACSGAQWQPGDAVVVEVDYTYHMIWPLAFGTEIPMTSTVRMRIE